MRKVLIVALTAVGIGIVAPSAMAAEAWKVSVRCKGVAPFEVVIRTSTLSEAMKIAERQNPGCSVYPAGK